MVTPLAGVEAALARTAEINPVVNALCLVDAEAARERARELESRLERGEDTGPLTGWTFTVKDAMQQAGYPCTAGSRALTDSVPRGDHGLRRASRGGGRDRDRAQQRARVLLSRHDAQRALRPDGQSVRARPLGRRKLGRWRQRRRARPRRAGARLRRRRLDPHSCVVLRHRRIQAHVRPRAARARHSRLAVADAFRPAHAHGGRLRPRADRDRRPPPARPALAARARPRLRLGRSRSPATSRTCAWLPRPTWATSASTARCGSASPRRWRPSRGRPGRQSSGRSPSSPRRSRSGMPSRAATTRPVRGRCSRAASWATTRAS